MSALQHYVASVAPYLHHYGDLAVGCGIFAESLGAPLPGETLLIAGAVLASQGHMGLGLLIVTAWVTAVMGDNTGYFIGRTGGRRVVLKYGGSVGVNQARFERVESFLRNYGRPAVAAARFFVVARQLNGLVAGAVRMSWWHFLLFNCLGALLWVSVWGLGVYFFGQHLLGLMPNLRYLGYGVGGIAVMGGVFLLYRLWRRRRWKS